MKNLLLTKFAELYKKLITLKQKYLHTNIPYLLLFVIITVVLYFVFIQNDTYLGKDIIVKETGEVLNVKTKKQILNWKILFKKDWNIDVEYATITNGYVDTRFSKYLNGKPKREYRITYSGNKDTKNEYFKEWYENGTQKTFLQYQKIQEWYENGVMSMECLNYQINDFQSYITTHTIVDDFPQLADGKPVEKNWNCKEWNEKWLLLKETNFDKQKVDTKSVEYFYTDSWSLDKKISYEKSTKIEEWFYPSGKQRNKITSTSINWGFNGITPDLQEEWYEDWSLKGIVEKSGSGTTFYQWGTIKEHTEENRFYKKWYFQNGSTNYEYIGQVWKTFDEQWKLIEECKTESVNKEYKRKECLVMWQYICNDINTKTKVEIVSCLDGTGKYLYQAPDEKWKNIPQK